MTSNLLEVKGLSKSFGGNKVTQNVTFNLAERAKEAIIGPNGAGKSTLFNLLTGYHAPDSGSIHFDRTDITGWSPHRISRSGIARAFQISNIFPSLTVRENVRSAVHAQMGQSLNMIGSARTIGTARTDEVIELCNLQDRRDVTAGELSQGDKKKLELALALASRPKLLLLDEPTAGMSLEETRSTMDLVDRLNDQLRLSVLFTEHDMSVVFNHASRVTLLHRGEIIVQGSPDEVRHDPTAQKIYLGEHQI
ncbi:ABC transporter ATP-binding protein [Pseudorhodoplanes sp.]|uniref:ABC transporter ATP-binding protein n=1 Tax=Pseudorhodoplanes sp. TaxID=1934341 RepID=UPI003D126705